MTSSLSLFFSKIVLQVSDSREILHVRYVLIQQHFSDTSLNVFVSSYPQRLFQWLVDQEYRLTEIDAYSFIPYLLIKVCKRE